MSTGYRPAQTANVYLGGRPQVRNWHNLWMFPTNNWRTCPTTSYKQIGNLSRIVPVPMYFLLEMSCLQLHSLFVIAVLQEILLLSLCLCRCMNLVTVGDSCGMVW